VRGVTKNHSAEQLAYRFSAGGSRRSELPRYRMAVWLTRSALCRVSHVLRRAEFFNGPTVPAVLIAQDARDIARSIPKGMRALVREELDRLDAEGGDA
jgi:hypothetical protein